METTAQPAGLVIGHNRSLAPLVRWCPEGSRGF